MPMLQPLLACSLSILKVLTQTSVYICSSSVFFVAAGCCKVFVVAVVTHSWEDIDPSFVYPYNHGGETNWKFFYVSY